jgi:hypothetical protein
MLVSHELARALRALGRIRGATEVVGAFREPQAILQLDHTTVYTILADSWLNLTERGDADNQEGAIVPIDENGDIC